MSTKVAIVHDLSRASAYGEPVLGLPVASVRRVCLLDSHTVNQIAAGEVVERPASVVKELVENALDAGARRIEVELVDSGKSLIRVSDDGCGMGSEDAMACLQRHATSKISAVDDLGSVGTLGFRGEALPSIASVSRMTLSTGDSDGLRSLLAIEGGHVSAPRGAGGPRGTEVRVEDLFFNTPARLKFLKSESTELAACLEHLSKYGIGYPEVAFRVTHNCQLAMETSGSGDLLQALAEVWGRDMARSLAEVDSDSAGIRVFGFVSPPHVTRPTRAYQYLYVNGRPVRSRTLMASLDQAFRDLTPERRYPVVALKLEVDPGKVDVNVSPTKSEVKFQHEGQAFDAVRYSVRAALMEHGMMPSASGVAAANEALLGSQAPGAANWALGDRHWALGAPSAGGSNVGFGASLGLVESGIATASSPHAECPPFSQSLNHPFGPASERQPFSDLLDGLRVIGQAMSTFIIVETSHGIAVIDQHVAHERVLYEYLCGLKGPTSIERQALLVPETLHVDKRAAVLLREKLDEVISVGFDIEPFGGESFLVRSAPAALRGKNPLKVLQDLIDELVDAAVTRRLVPTREQIWIMSSCKMAVKAGDPLTHAEMEKLIIDLATTENPYLCPHGRPITVTLGKGELLRKFGRS